MTVEQIKVKHLSADKHEAAFENGEIDAIVTFEPVRTKLLTLGAREIFSSKDIPGEIVDVMVVNNNAIKKHEKQIHTVIQGWFKALDDLHNKPEQSADVISQRQKISSQQVLMSYNGLKLPSISENKILLGAPDRLLQKNIRRMKEIMINEKLLRPGIPVSNLVSDRFIADKK